MTPDEFIIPSYVACLE